MAFGDGLKATLPRIVAFDKNALRKAFYSLRGQQRERHKIGQSKDPDWRFSFGEEVFLLAENSPVFDVIHERLEAAIREVSSMDERLVLLVGHSNVVP